MYGIDDCVSLSSGLLFGDVAVGTQKLKRSQHTKFQHMYCIRDAVGTQTYCTHNAVGKQMWHTCVARVCDTCVPHVCVGAYTCSAHTRHDVWLREHTHAAHTLAFTHTWFNVWCVIVCIIVCVYDTFLCGWHTWSDWRTRGSQLRWWFLGKLSSRPPQAPAPIHAHTNTHAHKHTHILISVNMSHQVLGYIYHRFFTSTGTSTNIDTRTYIYTHTHTGSRLLAKIALGARTLNKIGEIL